jgi:hypothetical protein
MNTDIENSVSEKMIFDFIFDLSQEQRVAMVVNWLQDTETDRRVLAKAIKTSAASRRLREVLAGRRQTEQRWMPHNEPAVRKQMVKILASRIREGSNDRSCIPVAHRHSELPAGALALI